MLDTVENKEENVPVPDDGSIVVNGVKLRKRVAEQLIKTGIPLGAFTPHELEQAIQNCIVDDNLIDDPDADWLDLDDGMELTDAEKHKKDKAPAIEDDDDDDDVPDTLKFAAQRDPNKGYCQKLRAARMQQKAAKAAGEPEEGTGHTAAA